MIKYIRTYFGYVEGQTIYPIEFFHETGFPTRYEALTHLSQTLFKGFAEGDIPGREACCQENIKGEKTYCSECGTALDSPVSWPAEFFHFIQSLQTAVSDDIGHMWFYYMEPEGWDFGGSPFGIEKTEALIIPENGAEYIFAAAIKSEWETKGLRQDFIDFLPQAHLPGLVPPQDEQQLRGLIKEINNGEWE